MTIAILYKSLTGNTALLAEAIKQTLKEDVIYCGLPNTDLTADFYFIGSWTDKGMCCKEIVEFLKTLENKKLAYFGTAGFGGSEEYYQTLFERIKGIIPQSNKIMGSFFCQGKMPMSVRERYVAMMTEHPDDKKLEVSVENFDKALLHPDAEDLENVKIWAQSVIK